MQGLVYKSTGNWYTVRNEAGDFCQARMPGRFKMDDITSTNPVAVGDWVDMVPEQGGEMVWSITAIHDRKNYVNRQSPGNRRLHHIVASNLDQAALVVTLREPRTSMGFADRFLVSCELYHLPALIVINKADAFRAREEETFEEWKEIYTTLGYPVIRVSAVTGDGMESLKQKLVDKTTLLSGHSGVGKSTLLNRIIPHLDLRTKEVSNWSGKGLHTTTFAEMFDLPGGGRIIDTPGLREFGLMDTSRRELSHYFPEMRAFISDCQFNNCLHIHEPGCAVQDALEQGKIAEKRFLSYLNILESIDENMR